MKNKAFTKLLKQLEKLTLSQSKRIEEFLHHKSTTESIEDSIGTADSCPYCHSESLHKWGMRSGLQRYRCKECHKTFNAVTLTPLARLQYKEQWLKYAADLKEGKSIRASAKDCHIHTSTSFRWRHRMLQIPLKTKADHLAGIVEFDETYFLESLKGERNLERKSRKRGGKASKRGISSEQKAVLIVRDRNGNTTDTVMEKSNQDTIAEIITPVVDKDALLCSDKKPVYEAFAKKYHFTLRTINLSKKEHTNGVVHVQNVNAYDSRLKAWMKRFNGVATKYLESYLGWMRLLDREKNITPKRLLAVFGQRSMICQPLVRT
jgi:transposase-like protein